MNKIWYDRHFVAFFLLPFSFLYRLIITVRRFFYKNKIYKSTKFSVPIIVVGNINVGGTGKTPLVIELANFLKQQNFKPGIISRGYGGKSTDYPQIVTANSDPKIVGDEAVLISQHTQCSMVVDCKRVAAVKKLLDISDCNVVISDDGLQHYALARDIEIAVVDGARRFGNGFCLPAGPLREPVSRLKQVDFIVVNGGDKLNNNEHALLLKPDIFYNLVNKEKIFSVEDFKNKTIHAVAGIGNPARFFQTLQSLGLTIIEHAFPDHYFFTKKDFKFVKENEIVIMTEKDAVKCESFADEQFYCLMVKTEVSAEFKQALLNKLNNIKNNNAGVQQSNY